MSLRPGQPYLFIHLPLELDNLVLHAGVELLQALGGARLDLQLLAPPAGLQAAVRTLDHDRSVALLPEPLPLQPAAHSLLDQRGLVVEQELTERDAQALKTAP